MVSFSPPELLLIVAGVTAVTLGIVGGLFCLFWLTWLRPTHRRMEELHRVLIEALTDPASERQTEGSELVARFRVAEGAKTVSIMEREGRRFLEVDGDLSNEERDQLLRYLRNEGFIE